MRKMLYQRVCKVLAEDGISGLPRRVARRVFDTDRQERARQQEFEHARQREIERAKQHEIERARQQEMERARQQELAQEKELAKQREQAVALEKAKVDYARQVEAFNSRADQLGYGHVKPYRWYHTIDLGNGLVTPGDYDYRDLLATYQFPADMRGMRVLDVGSATGFFAFEFEKRGAQVVSVELPSFNDWDLVTVELESFLRAEPDKAEVLDRTCVHGPFAFCHQILGSKIERCYSRIYDLCPEKLGGETFDLIFLGDVLGHLFSPLKALDVLAQLCRGTLVVSLDVLEPKDETPRVLYLGGGSQSASKYWFLPNRTCFLQMLDKVGFRHVSIAGEYSYLVRRCWLPSHRAIYHITK